MNKEDTAIHSFAGGVAGTTAAIATCPLEVLKTRLQSSGIPSSSSGSPTNTSTKSAKPSSAYSANLKVENHQRLPKLDSSLVAQSGQAKNVRRIIPSVYLPKPPPALSSQNLICQRLSGSFNFSILRHFRLNKTTFSLPNNGDMDVGNKLISAREWKRLSIYQQIKLIITREGILSLWRGVGPTLIGVAPARAIYFSAYSNAKAYFNQVLVPDTPIVHCLAAFSAGFFQTSCTNPIWMIRTRLQLDSQTGNAKLTIPKCIKKVYSENGLRGFYRGVTASYFGVSETIIYFVIYEHLKHVFVVHGDNVGEERRLHHFLQLMLCAGASRVVASGMTYPHEVARTRLREEGNKYRRFWQTLATVFREESWRGLYNGIGTNFLRTIPNTAITMGVYELVVYSFKGNLAF